MALLNLYCFSYAGGSSWAFRQLSQELAGRIEVVPVELPGRGRRRTERCIDQWDELTETLVSELAPRLVKPHAFLGYSLGALIALKVMHALEGQRIKDAAPSLALVACALGGPGIITHERLLHRMEDRAMFEALRDLGGIPDELMDSPELIALSAPSMRADLTLFETFISPGKPLAGVPIHAYYGNADASVGDGYAAWQSETDAAFLSRAFDGGHMFLHESASALGDALVADLALHEKPHAGHLASARTVARDT